MARGSDRVADPTFAAVMTGRCLAEARWATTPADKRPPAWSAAFEDDQAARLVAAARPVPDDFAAWVHRGAEQRWLELHDAERRFRGEAAHGSARR